MILYIETSSAICSVALSHRKECLGLVETNEPNIHSSHLSIFIQELMDKTGYSLSDMEAVAVSLGPGSYTGLRIGLATAKGICYATDAHLLPIPTLQAMAFGFSQKQILPPSSFIIPVLDARRNDVYAAVFFEKNQPVKEAFAMTLSPDSFDEYIRQADCYFIGDGTSKVEQMISPDTHIHFVHQIMPSAKDMIGIAEAMLTNQQFADLAYVEPFYR